MIQAFGASDPGCVRGNNEDRYLVAPSIGLYLVADGMGGAQAGEYASKLAVETVRDIMAGRSASHDGSDDGALLVAAFEEANRRVKAAAAKDARKEGMGTTLVAALDMSPGVLIASVGDSRASLYENGVLHTITEDQTWVNEVGRRLGVKEAVLKSHPMRHVLTMAIGASVRALRVQTYLLQPAPGAQVLLSSDGLHGVAREKDVASALGSTKPLEAKCRQLIAAARAQGGPDNITVVLLEIS
jgi:serine/threonine protein phosphatase PrpC